MRILLLVAAGAALAGCRTTLAIDPQPQGQVALIVLPHCAVFCRSSVVIQNYEVSASGAAPITASPDMSVSLKRGVAIGSEIAEPVAAPE